eukprot:1215795-Alexandrium_andersonii.AAC.1
MTPMPAPLLRRPARPEHRRRRSLHHSISTCARACWARFTGRRCADTLMYMGGCGCRAALSHAPRAP